jgi:hypothetical protein
VTPPVFALQPGSGAELDLDSPTAHHAAGRRWRGPVALLVAVVLIGASIGAVTRTLTAGTPPPALPQAELGFAEAHLDGDTVATLRVTVHNSSAAAVTVTSFEAEGIHTERVTAAVGRQVPPHATTAILVPVSADCTRSLIFTDLNAVLHLGDGTTVRAVPDRDLASAGGLCRQLRAALPDGWWDLWSGVTVRPVGDNLELTMPALEPGASLAGVWIGQTLLAYAAAAEPVGDVYKPIQLLPPDRCIVASGDRVPTGLRILLTGEGGLRNRYVVLGPDLARWIMRRC